MCTVKPTIKDTQLGSHCSDTYLYLFQCCFVMVFWWNCPSSRPTLNRKGKGGPAKHVNVIPSIDLSYNVTDCSYDYMHTSIMPTGGPDLVCVNNMDKMG